MNKQDLPNLDPQMGYFLLRATSFSNFDQKVLTKLYQPLIAPAAYTLYLTLWSEDDDQQLQSQRPTHFELFDLLGVDARTFLRARQQLEAVGLLRTYQKKDALGSFLVYQLFRPLPPEKFFQEEILATFLLEKVSRKQFMALQHRFQVPNYDLSQAQELTVGFLQVFHLPSSSLLVPPKAVKQGANHFKQKQTQANVSEFSPAELATMDWQTLYALVGERYVKAEELDQHQNEIYGLKKFYGFTLTDIARLIRRSLDAVSGKLDLRRLEQKALALYDQLHPQPTTNTKATASKPAVKTTTFSDTEQQLLKQVRQLAPMDFLNACKVKKHSYAGNQEKRNLRNLQRRGVFATATLNMLVFLALQEETTLTIALLDKFAQTWLQKGIQTPEEALSDYKERLNRPTKKYYAPKSRQRTKGPVPSWAKADQPQPSSQSATATKAKHTDSKIAAKLAQLEASRQNRSDS